MEFYFESFLRDMLLAVAIITTIIIIYTNYHYQHWIRHNIVQLTPKFPFGNVKSVILRQECNSTVYCKMYNTFKNLNVPFGGLYFAFRRELLILDLDIIKNIMVKDFNHFVDRNTYVDEENDPLTGHLFNLHGHKWRNLRAKLTPTFSSGKMKMMFNTLVACSDELNNVLLEYSSKSKPLDIKDILCRFTTDVIGSCAFGIDCNSLKNPNTEFRKYAQQIFEPVEYIDKFKCIGITLFPSLFKLFKINFINKNISKFYVDVVKNTIQYRQENNINRNDFMHLLLEIKNYGQIQEDTGNNTSNGTLTSESGLTFEEIAAQCFVFFLAGFETTATTLTFCLYELIKNEEIQEKVREEINSVLEMYDNKLTYETTLKMHYMEKVINEALRKYPPLGFFTRRCTKDYHLPNSNYVIREGDMIRISNLGLHRDPEYYPNPEKFDPERFSNDVKSQRHPFTYMPFGVGPRNCIGMRFGLMQAKVALSVLLKNYKFTLNKKTLEPLVLDSNNLVLSIKGGIWLNVNKI